MKKEILFALLICLNQIILANVNNRIDHIRIDKYELNSPFSHIVLPTDFGKPFIIDQKQLDLLNENEVYQIDLVYTEFKTNPDFDQEKLNENRISELKALIPTIDKNSPNWNFVEQTQATVKAEAKTYFHGFVIHYRPNSVNYGELKDKFDHFHKQTQSYMVNASTSTSLDYSSGTKIHIPANAVTYKNGEPVKGDYQIVYREYRNQADIALSGIPMTYEQNGENLSFSSVGMYEINGFKDGEELQLQKPINIDFNCTKKVDDAAFYELDENTGEWTKIEDLSADRFGAKINEPAISKVTASNNLGEDQPIEGRNGISLEFVGGMRFSRKNIDANTAQCKMNKKAWKNYEAIKDDINIAPMVTKEDSEKRTVHLISDSADVFVWSVQSKKYTTFDEFFPEGNAVGWKDDGNRTAGTMIGGKMKFLADAGHTYPNLVAGLNTSEFGVYNCDQIYRMGKTKTIHPEYIDSETGEEIKAASVACLMDLNYNGSFSFDPNYVTLNPTGKNALLIFTKDDQTYLILPSEFGAVDLKKPFPVVAMKNVTSEIKSSADLKRVLQL